MCVYVCVCVPTTHSPAQAAGEQLVRWAAAGAGARCERGARARAAQAAVAAAAHRRVCMIAGLRRAARLVARTARCSATEFWGDNQRPTPHFWWLNGGGMG